jgi:hypothetical protein
VVTEFERMTDELEGESSTLPQERRTLFLLAYSQRFAPLFAMFEKRAKTTRKSFGAVLDTLWEAAAGRALPSALMDELLALIPGEDWVVDGFFDGIAQYVGGLAVGALQGLSNGDGIDDVPETGIFSCFRPILSEMRLGCMEPAGNDPQGQMFEANLHNEPIILAESKFWRELLDRIAAGPTVDQLRDFALANMFDPASLEPDLSRGLAKDAADARKFLEGH